MARPRRADPAADPADPFGTAGLRAAVLAGWAAAPHRFREDANAEEALAAGGYRDRVLIELLANAVDAAAAAGEPGRVRVEYALTPAGSELRVANNGLPLTAAGVVGLATLRASAKRHQRTTVGHFGVGFTAVAAVSDCPQLRSTGGGVRFDRTDSAAAVADLAQLRDELAERGGQVPVLRLVWPLPDPPPEGWTSEVRLPLRAESAAGVLAEVTALGADMFWALPGLAELAVQLPDREPLTMRREELPDGTTVLWSADQPERYRVLTTTGSLPARLLAELPTEERDRSDFRVSWVDRLAPDGTRQQRSRIGAPTPTDEELSVPALLIGTFPVDDTRRRIAPGPVADLLLDTAVDLFGELIAATPDAERLDLLPVLGFPLGPIDSRLRADIMAAACRAPILRTTGGSLIRPVDAAIIPGIGAAAELIGQALPELVSSPTTAARTQALQALGVRVLPLSAGSAALAGIGREPLFWHRLYELLADQDAEQLADLPVPLAGGGRRIGARGALLPGGIDQSLLDRLVELAPEVPLVDPRAAHQLLRRLGARPADATELATAPALVQLYRQLRDELTERDPDPQQLADFAALALDLAAAGGRGGLLELVVLTDDEDTPWPAGELLAPDAPLAGVLAADADLPPLHPRWADHPAQVLEAVGVRRGLRVVPIDGPDDDLPDVADWWEEVVGGGPPPDEAFAIADLDLIDDGCWPQTLQLITADRAARDALLGPIRPSYSAWWLSRFAELDGVPIGHYRTAAATELAGLYPELPAGIDPATAELVGVLTGLPDAVRSDPAELLRRYADPDLLLPPAVVPAVTAAVVQALAADPDLQLPQRIRALDGASHDPFLLMVLDQPWFAQLAAPGLVIPGGADPQRVAQVLDADTAGALLAQVPIAGGPIAGPVPGLAAAAAALGVPAPRLSLVPDLTADGRRVGWWCRSGEYLVDGSAQGVGRAVAHAAGRWADRRLAVAAAGEDLLSLSEFGS